MLIFYQIILLYASRVFLTVPIQSAVTTAAEVDTSFPEEDGSLLPGELIIQSLPQPTFKYRVLQLSHCSGASGGFTEHANTKTTLIVL